MPITFDINGDRCEITGGDARRLTIRLRSPRGRGGPSGDPVGWALADAIDQKLEGAGLPVRLGCADGPLVLAALARLRESPAGASPALEALGQAIAGRPAP